MQLPFLAFILGLLGLAPFAALGSWLFLAGLFAPFPRLAAMLLAYGGCVLSFLGAIHWGLALRRPDIISARGTAEQDRRHLLLGAGAPLWAWLSLCIGWLASIRWGFIFEIAGFTAVFVLEREAGRRGALPQGYLPFRAVLTAGAVFFLLLAALQAP